MNSKLSFSVIDRFMLLLRIDKGSYYVGNNYTVVRMSEEYQIFIVGALKPCGTTGIEPDENPHRGH